MLKSILISFSFLFLFPAVANAQVVINEFVANGDPKEWVEFKNSSGSAEYLKNYWLDDDTDFNDDSGSSTKKLLSTLNISSATYPYYEISGSFLNNDGDDVAIFDSSGNLVDYYHYDSSQGSNVAMGRSPDGTGGFYFLLTPTKGTSNSNPQTTPIPSPTPTPTSTSTPTPTSTPTSTPISTPKSTVKATPKPSSSSSSSEEGGGGEEVVLGLREELSTPEPTPEEEEKMKKKFPIIAVVFIIGGVGMMGGAGYLFFKPKLLENKKHEIQNPPLKIS